MRAFPSALFTLSCVTLLLGARPARATPNFPAAIEMHLKLKAAPACTICHSSNGGGTGTVTKPFGLAMKAAGLQPFDVASLDAALDALKAANTSSAGDEVPDITKLEEGMDPNVPVNGSFGPAEPAFGCGAHVAPSATPPGRPAESFFSLVVLAAALSRRRRTPR